MMREWDVPGRCCAGRGWWCAMACFFCYGFHTSAAEFCKLNQTAEKNGYHFMLFGVYAGIISSFVAIEWFVKYGELQFTSHPLIEYRVFEE